jgi:hypothetical protein
MQPPFNPAQPQPGMPQGMSPAVAPAAAMPAAPASPAMPPMAGAGGMPAPAPAMAPQGGQLDINARLAMLSEDDKDNLGTLLFQADPNLLIYLARVFPELQGGIQQVLVMQQQMQGGGQMEMADNRPTTPGGASAGLAGVGEYYGG